MNTKNGSLIRDFNIFLDLLINTFYSIFCLTKDVFKSFIDREYEIIRGFQLAILIPKRG